MPTEVADQGSNSVAYAPLTGLAGQSISLSLPEGATRPDAGSETLTVTQGTNSVTLGFADGATSVLGADGVTWQLTAPLPYPLTGGLEPGLLTGLAGTYAVGGVPFTVGDTGELGAAALDIEPDAGGVFSVTQGKTRQTLPFVVPPALLPGLASAALLMEPRSPLAPFAPDPAAGLSGAALDAGGLGETPPVLRLAFPAGWGEGDIPAGQWNAFAQAAYLSGATDRIPLYPKSAYPAAPDPTDTGSAWDSSYLTVIASGAAAPADAGAAEILDLRAQVADLTAQLADLTAQLAAAQTGPHGVGNDPLG